MGHAQSTSSPWTSTSSLSLSQRSYWHTFCLSLAGATAWAGREGLVARLPTVVGFGRHAKVFEVTNMTASISGSRYEDKIDRCRCGVFRTASVGPDLSMDERHKRAANERHTVERYVYCPIAFHSRSSPDLISPPPSSSPPPP